MLTKEHYQALTKLEDADAENRKEGTRLLMELESEGKLGEAEMHQLLEYDKASILLYAIEASARMRIESVYPKIEKLLKETQQPYLLNKIVESFARIDDGFLKKTIFEKFKAYEKKSPHILYDREQTAIHILKYLQKHAEIEDLKFFLPFLEEESFRIVLNALQVFAEKNFPLKKEDLEKLKGKFKKKLLQEQIDILLNQLKVSPNYS